MTFALEIKKNFTIKNRLRNRLGEVPEQLVEGGIVQIRMRSIIQSSRSVELDIFTGFKCGGSKIFFPVC